MEIIYLKIDVIIYFFVVSFVFLSLMKVLDVWLDRALRRRVEK